MASHFFRSTAFLFLSRKAQLATAMLIILMSLSLTLYVDRARLLPHKVIHNR